MNTHTHKPRPVEAIRYSDETERQIIEALGATEITKVADQKERQRKDEARIPVFIAKVDSRNNRKVPNGTYEFNTGDYLVLCDGGFEGELCSITGYEDARGAGVLPPSKFHRLYQ